MRYQKRIAAILAGIVLAIPASASAIDITSGPGNSQDFAIRTTDTNYVITGNYVETVNCPAGYVVLTGSGKALNVRTLTFDDSSFGVSSQGKSGTTGWTVHYNNNNTDRYFIDTNAVCLRVN